MSPLRVLPPVAADSPRSRALWPSVPHYIARANALADPANRLSRLDAQPRKRILKFLNDRVAKLDNPRTIGHALRGSTFGEFWKYRVGGNRLICKIEDDRPVVLVLRLGRRSEVHR